MINFGQYSSSVCGMHAATHCTEMVSDEEPVKVVCGEYRLLDTGGTDVRLAKEVATHPQWDKPLEYSYDFGLMLVRPGTPINAMPTLQFSAV